MCQRLLEVAKQIANPRRLRSDMGEDPPDEPRGDCPTCAREEAHAEPDADLVEVDGGGHVEFSLVSCGSVRRLE